MLSLFLYVMVGLCSSITLSLIEGIVSVACTFPNNFGVPEINQNVVWYLIMPLVGLLFYFGISLLFSPFSPTPQDFITII